LPHDELTAKTEKETTMNNATNNENPQQNSTIHQQPKENQEREDSASQDSIEYSDMELDAYTDKLEQQLLSSTPARRETTTNQNTGLPDQQGTDKNESPTATSGEEKGNELKRILVMNLREFYRQIRRLKTIRRKK